ncbi:MAG TPA: hypothetical protein VE996_07700 [Terriglobales bacterium]|nr:hypothetical protein [Terriglobales bacterium]
MSEALLSASRAAELIAAAGAHCLGVREGSVWLNDPVTRTTLALPLRNLTLRRLTAALYRSRKQFMAAQRRARQGERLAAERRAPAKTG